MAENDLLRPMVEGLSAWREIQTEREAKERANDRGGAQETDQTLSTVILDYYHLNDSDM